MMRPKALARKCQGGQMSVSFKSQSPTSQGNSVTTSLLTRMAAAACLLGLTALTKRDTPIDASRGRPVAGRTQNDGKEAGTIQRDAGPQEHANLLHDVWSTPGAPAVVLCWHGTRTRTPPRPERRTPHGAGRYVHYYRRKPARFGGGSHRHRNVH